MYKQIIIDDQKETIRRLQQECTEKTNAIIALGERLKVKEQEYEKLTKECEIWKNQVLTIDDEAITVQITQQQFEEYNKLKSENEELKKDNSTLKDILSYPKYTNENAYNELLKLSKAELIKNLIESHQHGESTTQVVYRSISEENTKYKQTLTEIQEIAEVCSFTDSNELLLNRIKQILQKISKCEVEND